MLHLVLQVYSLSLTRL
jgi:hypothetical protein